MSDMTKTIKIFIRKGSTQNQGDVRNFRSARIDQGVEIEVPLSNVDAEFERWNEYVDKRLAQEMAEQLAKLNCHPESPSQDRGSTAIMTDDPYVALPWRKAPRDPRLAMIRVTAQLSALGQELHKKLKAAKNKTLRSSNATYKLWLTQDGEEFLQRWSSSTSMMNPSSSERR
jgi:hypothetical protein